MNFFSSGQASVQVSLLSDDNSYLLKSKTVKICENDDSSENVLDVMYVMSCC